MTFRVGNIAAVAVCFLLGLAFPPVSCAAFHTNSLPAFGSFVSTDTARCLSVSDTALYSTPQRPKARRALKKKRRRNKVSGEQKGVEDEFWQTAESRPLIAADAIEAGEDYWIDETDLEKSLEREEAIKNRKAMEGEIPKEKLVAETVAPYTQNWIGLFSIFIITIATIVTQFPELLNSPVIEIPDL